MLTVRNQLVYFARFRAKLPSEMLTLLLDPMHVTDNVYN